MAPRPWKYYNGLDYYDALASIAPTVGDCDPGDCNDAPNYIGCQQASTIDGIINQAEATPTPALDRQSLEKALAYYEQFGDNVISEFSTIRAAARKHLETLPKTRWRVTGTKGEKPLGSYVWTTRERALDSARRLLDHADTVSVQPVQVPA